MNGPARVPITTRVLLTTLHDRIIRFKSTNLTVQYSGILINVPFSQCALNKTYTRGDKFKST